MTFRTASVAALSLLIAATAAVVAPTSPASAAPGSGRYFDPIFAGTSPTVVPVGDSETARPAILFIHGGGFRVGDKARHLPTEIRYAQKGYVTLGVNYRLDPTNRCQDLQDGVFTVPADIAAEMISAATDPVFGLAKDAAFDLEGFKTVLRLRADFEGRTAAPPERYFDLSFHRRALAGL